MPGCTDFFAKYRAMQALQEDKIARSGSCHEAWIRMAYLTKFAQLEEKMSRVLMSDPSRKECGRQWNATLLRVRGDRQYAQRSLSYATAACHFKHEEEQQSPTAGQ